MKTLNVIILLFFFLAFGSQAFATHIVGGEFELLHIEGNRYRLNLILYSDVRNMDPRNPIDPFAQVHIWNKGNSQQPVESIYLDIVEQKLIPYTNPDCVIPQLETSKTVYSSVISLSPERYNSEAGYYINYERCCRNGVINNIEDPGATGQSFYMEFPALEQNGEPFINSSPNLFPPLSDFARLGYPFYFDFSGTDADGDQIVYSLTTPLAGSSSQAQGNIVPPARPAPYNQVQWAPGFRLNNMVPGNPALRISNEGIIKVTPTQTGLFVFAVLAEEFRNGKKIGEVRREFQMLVYDYQGDDYPPVLSAKKQGNQQVFRDEITLREVDFSDFENNRCITLTVEDQDVDAENATNKGREPLNFKIRPVNFNMLNPDEMLSVTAAAVDTENRSFSLDLCLPLCPPTDMDPYIFDIIAFDDACAVPLTDTLRVTVHAPLVNENTPPVTSSSLTTTTAHTINLEREIGETIVFSINGFDPDNNNVHLWAGGDDFVPADYGMNFTPQSGKGNVTSSFNWKPDCDNVNLTSKSMFSLFFITEDEDLCDLPDADTLRVNIKLKSPLNEAPALSILDMNVYFVEANIDSSLTFQLQGIDGNSKDLLSMQLDSLTSSEGGNMLAYGWQNTEGNSHIQSALVIDPDCNIFSDGAEERSFTFYFSLKDNPCFTSQTDTLSLKVIFREKNLNFDDVKFINVFTPNGDELNDYFQIENLPAGACYNKLESIVVFNRWGKVLYDTTDPKFRWNGEDFPTGSYYYQVKYTHTSFRSSLTLIRGDNALLPAQSQ